MKSGTATAGFTGVLRRLRRDAAGNTLAIMAAMLVPLIAFTGSAIDMARLYVVKVRLQQACDAGVLAGRKSMTDTTTGSTTLDSAANTQAQAFFKNNFVDGWYQTTSVSFSATKAVDGSSSTAANSVLGSATATVPMAVMYFFGVQPRKIDVTCQARFDLADNDIMFVLDTTGSMSCLPSDPENCSVNPEPYNRKDGTKAFYSPEKAGSKLDALRDAVVQFDTVMRQNADATSHFRYGFVPYSASVNVGGVIPAAYLEKSNWKYQTRAVVPNSDYDVVTGVEAVATASAAECAGKRVPATGYRKLTYYKQGAATPMTYYTAATFTGGTTYYSQYSACYGSAVLKAPVWKYEQRSIDVSNFVTGNWVTTPGRLDGATSKWRGCIEEQDTTVGSSFGVNALPADLNPDIKTGKWRPAWPEVVWARNSTAAQTLKESEFTEDSYTNPGYLANYSFDPGRTTSLGQGNNAPCGMAAKTLSTMSAADVQAYVDDPDFRANGYTYHDYGMIWGVRMLSPNGVFGSTTAAWPGRNDPARSIVFMTDGTMSTNTTLYGLYGYEGLDGRVNGGDVSKEGANHIARFRLLCDAAKQRDITIYVVALGTSINSDLTYCASPGQTYEASSKTELTNAFKSIATKIAMLRITK